MKNQSKESIRYQKYYNRKKKIVSIKKNLFMEYWKQIRKNMIINYRMKI